jgi:hypothetical protein
MKRIFTLAFALLCCCLVSVNSSIAQVTGYVASNSLGTFTPISGGTVLGDDLNEGEFWSGDPVNPALVNPGTGSFFVNGFPGFNIGFNFNLGGVWYDRFAVGTDGYIQLGISSYPSQMISHFQSTALMNSGNAALNGMIAGFARDLEGNTGTATLKYLTTGSAGSRVLTVEWLSYKRFGAIGDNINFQIKLYETTNVVEVVYGTFATVNVTAAASRASMGIRGNGLGADSRKYGVGEPLSAAANFNMDAPIVAATNVPRAATALGNQTINFINGFVPTSGRTYTMTPGGIGCNSPVIPTGSVSGTTVNLSWGAAAGATNYTVEYRALPAGVFAAAPGSPTTLTSFSVTGLSPSTSYEFRIRTNCGGPLSPSWAPTLTFTIPGPGENCALAIPITVAANAGACSNTVVNAGLANDGGNVSCLSTPGASDIYYSFVAPSDGSKIVIETFQNLAQDPDWAMEILDACGGTVVGCNDDRNGALSDYRPYVDICSVDYTPGATYFIRLTRWSFAGTSIQLCVYKDAACPPSPANNLCASATTVAVGVNGTCPSGATEFTTSGATSQAFTNPSCDPFGIINDVWITFNSGANTSVLLSYTLASATSVKAAVYSACGGPVFGGLCFTGAGNYALNGLTASTDYLIRFWTNSAVDAGTFNVCLQETPNCPGGLGSIVNVASIPYNSGSRTTCGAGDDITTGMLAATCGSNNYLGGEDEVFQFQVPSTGSYQILLNSNSSWVGMKLFANCPLAGRGGTCVAAIGTSASDKTLNSLNLTAGVDYYLIVDQFPSPTCIPEYILTIQATPPPPTNDNCGVATATLLTQGTTCSYFTDAYSGSATPSPEVACPGGVSNDDDVWYKFVAATSNPIITVNPSAGYYPVVELHTACGGTSVCCVFPGSIGSPVSLSSPTPLTPGNTYYIRVYHAYSGPPSTTGFDICVVNGPVVVSCLVPPGGTIAETEACGADVNSSNATSQLMVDGSTYQGTAWAECNTRDLDYYKIVTTQSGYLTLTLNAEFPATFNLYKDNAGALGPLLANASTSDPCTGNLVIASPSSQTAGTYYVLVTPSVFIGYGCGGLQNDYVLTPVFTVAPPLPPPNDNCSGAIQLTVCGTAQPGRTLSATQQSSPIICAGDQSVFGKEVWYKFTALATQATINVAGNFDGVLEVQQGYCGGSSFACSDALGNNEVLSIATLPGVVYYVRYYAFGISDPPPGNFTISVTIPGGWSGLTDNNWGVATNWCSGVVPGVGSNVTIPDVSNDPATLSVSNCNNLTLLPGATIVTAPNDLNVKGNFSASGNTLSGSGKLIFSGASAQAISGSINFANVQFSNTNLGGVSVSNGASVNINGVMSVDANARVNNTGTGALTVVSNATTEGSIGPVGALGQLNGNFTLQRYIPNAASGWHFLGTSVSGNNYGQWTDDLQITASTGLGNGVIFMSEPERANIFQYSEVAHNVKLDTVQKDGWRVPTSPNIAVGRGYRMYVKPAFFANNPSRIMENVGPVTTGLGAGYNFPAMTRNEYTPCFPSTPTFNPTVCNESNRGWNLLSNPFPSNINWDAAGWTKPASMNNAFYTWNGTGAGYQVYVGSGGISLGVNASTNTNPNIIAKGQGFFVGLRTAGSYTATLTATEAVKSATSAQFVRTAVVDSKLKVRISRIAPAMDYSFDANVQFMSGASEGFDMHIDASLMRGANASVGFKAGNEDLIQSTLPSLDGATRVVDLRTFYAGQTGTFKLSFPDITEFPANTHVYLKDNVLNAMYDLAVMPEVGFNVASTNNLNSNDRFQLVFSPVVLTTVAPSINGEAIFSVYPNPSNGSKVVASMIGFDDEKVVVTVVDMLGKVVYTSEQVISADRNAEHAIKANLSSGVYNISCVGAKHKFTTKLVVE